MSETGLSLLAAAVAVEASHERESHHDQVGLACDSDDSVANINVEEVLLGMALSVEVDEKPMEVMDESKGGSRSSSPKQAWSIEEDEKLKTLLNDGWDGESLKTKWSDIARKMSGRTPKQCRERWHQHLRPGLVKGNWTAEEDALIDELYEEFGSSWSKMREAMPHRTDNDIKNRWNAKNKSSRKKSTQQKSERKKKAKKRRQPTTKVLATDKAKKRHQSTSRLATDKEDKPAIASRQVSTSSQAGPSKCGERSLQEQLEEKTRESRLYYVQVQSLTDQLNDVKDELQSAKSQVVYCRARIRELESNAQQTGDDDQDQWAADKDSWKIDGAFSKKNSKQTAAGKESDLQTEPLTSFEVDSSLCPSEDFSDDDDQVMLDNKMELGTTLSGRSRKLPARFRMEEDVGSLKRRAWTPDEDTALWGRWKRHRDNWTLVSKGLSGRSDEECRERFHRRYGSLNTVADAMAVSATVQQTEQGSPQNQQQAEENMHSERLWASEEDILLKKRVELHMDDWEKVASGVHGRSVDACKDRYYFLKSLYSASTDKATDTKKPVQNSRKREYWTAEEDSLLMKRFAFYGDNYEEIAKGITGRNGEACKGRLRRIGRGPTPASAVKQHLEEQHLPSQRQAWTTEEESTLNERLQLFGNDWHQIAAGMPGRTARACEARACKRKFYCEGRDPMPAQSWTPEEDSVLNERIELCGNNWEKIAEGMPGRIALACEARARHVVPSLVACGNAVEEDGGDSRQGQAWTQEEDDLLKERIDLYGDDWHRIAAGIPGRNGRACEGRSRRACEGRRILPKKIWSKEEDRILLEKWSRLGPDWKEIAKSIPNRTARGCQTHFIGQIEPLLNTTKASSKESSKSEEPTGYGRHKQWSAVEDHILMEKSLQLGTNWEAISQSIPGRSARACEAHFKAYTESRLNAPEKSQKESNSVLSPPPKKRKLDGGRAAPNSAGGGQRKDSWTAEEDRVLIEKVGNYGSDWERIAEEMPGRSDRACETRFQKKLKFTLESGKLPVEAVEDSGDGEQSSRPTAFKKPRGWTLPPIVTNGNLPRNFNWIKTERCNQPVPPKPPRWTPKDLRMVKSLLL